MEKYKYIDAVRGWAILGVLFVHASGFGNNDKHAEWLSAINRNGSTGVQLFFMASALTLFMSLSHRSKTEKGGMLNFFIRRFFRIAPLYYLGIIFYLFTQGVGPRYWLGDAKSITVSNIISNFLFLHQLNPYWINSVVPGGWSIAVEMSFYLLVPLLFKYITTVDRAIFFFIGSVYFSGKISAFVSANCVTACEELWGSYSYFILPTQFPAFALGVLLFFLIRDSTNSDNQLKINPISVLSLILFFGIQGLSWLSLLVTLAFIVCLMSKWKIIIFENRIMCFIGTLSYGLYICHWGVLEFMKKCGLLNFIEPTTVFRGTLNFGIKIAVLLLIGCSCAYLLHRFIELPMQAYGKRIIDRRMRLN